MNKEEEKNIRKCTSKLEIIVVVHIHKSQGKRNNAFYIVFIYPVSSCHELSPEGICWFSVFTVMTNVFNARCIFPYGIYFVFFFFIFTDMNVYVKNILHIYMKAPRSSFALGTFFVRCSMPYNHRICRIVALHAFSLFAIFKPIRIY